MISLRYNNKDLQLLNEQVITGLLFVSLQLQIKN